MWNNFQFYQRTLTIDFRCSAEKLAVFHVIRLVVRNFSWGFFLLFGRIKVMFVLYDVKNTM